MKIGIIGPANSIENTRSLLHMEDAFIECVEYPCNLNKVVELLGEVQHELDGILFTGARYFAYACRHASAHIPWTYLKRSMASTLCALLEAKTANQDLTRITYDLHSTTTEKMFDILCEKVGLPQNQIALYRYNDTDQYKDYLNASDISGHYASRASKYHLENLRKNKASICLTDSPSVVNVVRKAGYPAFFTSITSEDVALALNELRLRCQFYEQQGKSGHQEAVLCLGVYMDDNNDDNQQEYRKIQGVCQIETALFTFAQGIGATVERSSDLQYVLYSTRDELDAITDHLKNLDFLQSLLAVIGVEKISMGIGFHVSHSIAKVNAQQASKSATQQKYSCYYVKDQDSLSQGPFLIKADSTENDFDKMVLERTSRRSGVGTTVLAKLLQAQRQYGFQTVTSTELAQMTGLSLNNIHRVVSKLEETGYVEFVGKQSCAEHGRPRRLIKFNLAFVPQKNN